MMQLNMKPNSLYANYIIWPSLLLLLIIALYIRLNTDNYISEVAVFSPSPSLDCSYFGLPARSIKEEQLYHVYNNLSSHACSSQYQQHCLRKNTSPKYYPPPPFLSALRDYERFHNSCTSGYNLTTLATNSSLSPQGCKYLVWKSLDGMGNQLVTLVSAFIYSLLTRRVFLIALDSHIQQHLCNPFPSSTWVLPDDFPEPDLRTNSMRLVAYVNGIVKNISKEEDRRNLGSSPDLLGELILDVPHSLQVFLICCDDRRDHYFFCPTTHKLLSGVSWIYFHSHEYSLPALYFVPEFREKLNEWFPDKSVFMHTARYLLNPQDHLWKRILMNYKVNMNDADRRLGIQIRSWDHKFSPLVSKQVLRCVTEQKLLPNPSTVLPKPSQNSTSSDMTGQKEKVAVMVTSLRHEYYEELTHAYSTSNNSAFDLDFFTASQEGSQQTGNIEHDEKAIIDIWLLSFSDDLITTPKSTFGSSASGLAGIIPILFKKYGENKLEEAACERSNLAGPCFMVYPRQQICPLDPRNASIEDPTQKVPEIKYCYLNQPGISVYAG